MLSLDDPSDRRLRTARVAVTTAAVVLLATLAGGVPPVAAQDSEVTSGASADQEPVAGEIVRIAGVPVPHYTGEGYSGDGGPATEARLSGWLGVATASDGTVYLADWDNGRLRAVGGDGIIDTVLRASLSPEIDRSGDFEGWTDSPYDRPRSADVADDGTVVVGGDRAISRITPDGEVEMIAGGGEGLPEAGEMVAAGEISVRDVADVAVAANGTVYAAYGWLRGVIIAIDPEGTARLLAGGGDEWASSADGTRPATDYAIGGENARLALAEDGPNAGTLYVADGDQVFAIDPDGTLSVVAGTGEAGYSGDGGPATESTFQHDIGGLAVDADGGLVVGDTFNEAIRYVHVDGTMSTLRAAAGKVGSLDVLPTGDIVFTRDNSAFRLTVAGESATTVEGAEPPADPFADLEPGEVAHLAGAPDQAQVVVPQAGHDGTEPWQAGVAVDGDGRVHVADPDTNTVRRVEPDGTTTIAAGVWPVPEDATSTSDSAPDAIGAHDLVLDGVRDLATAADGSILVAAGSHVWRLADETLTRVGSFGWIGGIAVGADDSVYVTETWAQRVRRIDPEGTVETIAGGGDRSGDEADGHPALEAELREPFDVAVDADGAVYLTETGQPYVRRIDPDGTVTTVLGDSRRRLDEGGYAGDGGPGAEAEVNTPGGLAIGPDGALYVADTYNARVRRLGPDGTVTTVAGNGSIPDDGSGEEAAGAATEVPIGEPRAVAFDADGALIISAARTDAVYRVTEAGVESVADLPSWDEVPGIDDGTPATEAALSGITDIAVGPDGLPVLSTYHSLMVVSDTLTSLGTSGGGTALSGGDAMFVAADRILSRVHPDGRRVWVAGAGGEEELAAPSIPAPADLSITDVAPAADGSVYVRNPVGVLRIGADGAVEPVDLGARGNVAAIATASDGTLYGADTRSGTVFRFDGDGGSTAVVAPSDEPGDRLTDTPNGDATAMAATSITDIAASEGHLYLATGDGIVTVDLDADTYALHEAWWDDPPSRLMITADQHGNVYAAAGTISSQVSVLVRPGEIAAPVPWGSIVGVGVAGVAGVVVLLLVLRRRRSRGAASSSSPSQSAVQSGLTRP